MVPAGVSLDLVHRTLCLLDEVQISLRETDAVRFRGSYDHDKRPVCQNTCGRIYGGEDREGFSQCKAMVNSRVKRGTYTNYKNRQDKISSANESR